MLWQSREEVKEVEVTYSFEDFKLALTSAKPKPKSRSQKRERKAQNPETGVKLQWDVQLPEFHVSMEYEPKCRGQDVGLAEENPSFDALLYGNDTVTDDSWNGEAYEKPGHKSADGGAFWRFQKHIQSRPRQCLRYSFNGMFLNPTNKTVTAPNCPICGKKRVFELQLMPNLITALYDAGQSLQDKAVADPAIREICQRAIDCFMEWDWSSIAVFTCPQSCCPDSLNCQEEHVTVCSEMLKM